jgi:transglutaminase-like putative cysteine protease
MIRTLFLLAVQTHWWGPQVDLSLDRAPTRKANWVHYLESVQPADRPSVEYLLSFLPYYDLLSLEPAKLDENVRLALKARTETPWGQSVPDDIFNDDVLPHACVGEPRDSMRAEFHDRYIALAKAARSPGDAALALNKTLFRDYKVKYDTKRLRTDQSPRETISQGIATCTGLAIMLIDACRAVGIPARLAGINSWPGRGGNHTWVEIWDREWHFVGAAEPDAQGLDHAWFVADAAKAVKSKPLNAIYAVTYHVTGDYFPSAWDSDSKFNAINVTDRYTGAAVSSSVRLMIDVHWHGERVSAVAEVRDAVTGVRAGAGTTLGPADDTNHFLTVLVPIGEKLSVKVNFQGHTAEQTTEIHEDTVLKFDLTPEPQ